MLKCEVENIFNSIPMCLIIMYSIVQFTPTISAQNALKNIYSNASFASLQVHVARSVEKFLTFLIILQFPHVFVIHESTSSQVISAVPLLAGQHFAADINYINYYRISFPPNSGGNYFDLGLCDCP